MRKPDRTKKTSTPRKPPRNHGISLWYRSTPATAMARTPSRPARYILPPPGRACPLPDAGSTPALVPDGESAALTNRNLSGTDDGSPGSFPSDRPITVPVNQGVCGHCRGDRSSSNRSGRRSNVPFDVAVDNLVLTLPSDATMAPRSQRRGPLRTGDDGRGECDIVVVLSRRRDITV